jgi:hypothetical protein
MDICQLILELRPDLCKRFDFDKPENKMSFLAWLFTTGINEYKILQENNSYLEEINNFSFDECYKQIPTNLQRIIFYARPDVQAEFPLPHKLPDFLQWFYTYGIVEHKLWKWLSPVEKTYALKQPEPWAEKITANANAALVDDPYPYEPIPIEKRPWGVNLIGYAYGQLGIGEDVRMAGRALLEANIPFNIVNFQPGADVGQNDKSMAAYVLPEGIQGNYAINIFCLTALEHGRFFVEQGNKQIAGRYNIGYWPWELAEWPPQWNDLISLVDEVWVSTQHTFDAVEPVVALMPNPLSLRIMPMAVELGSIALPEWSRTSIREYFGLPICANGAYLFCFSFDLNSSIYRKNPQAAVEAFLRAFPFSEWNNTQVGLVIKVHQPKRPNKSWERLKQLAREDNRIHIVESTLDRPMLLALYKACDCFLSLHRAEGFGRGIAEVLQLGLHVITTAYSGNMDFCQYPDFSQQIDLIRYRLVSVKKGQYPYGKNQVWANANINHAAQRMRILLESPRKQPFSNNFSLFSPRVIGERYKKRLLKIDRMIKNEISI